MALVVEGRTSFHLGEPSVYPLWAIHHERHGNGRL
jgi:hypothetical protein